MTLSASEQRILRVFTAAVLGRFDEVVRLRRAAPAGEPDRRWREALLQVHVFAGFPRLVEAYGVLAAEGGLGAVDADELGSSDRELERARGTALFERIYTTEARSVRALLEGYHADFADWILEHAYGRVLARPGLEPRLRELLAVCALSAFGQERQLASHVRGALRCGAERGELDEALACISDLTAPQPLERARRVVERFG